MPKDTIKNSITGYGLVFKRVMKDKDISIEAKALYSYLSAYAGSDESSFPSVELIKPKDSISLRRIINVPKRSIGDTTVEKLQNHATEIDDTLYNVLLDVDYVPGLTARSINPIKKFTDMMEEIMVMSEQLSVSQLIEYVLEKTGYLQVDRKQNGNIYGSNLYTLFHNPRQVDNRPVDSQPVEIQSVDNQPTTNNSITNNSITSNSKTINNSATDVTRERFEEWWKLYDKKRDKKISFKKFEKCLKEHSFEEIMEGTRMYLKTIKDKQYQKDPKTFLHNESYMNDYSDELKPSGLDQLERMKYDESYWD